MCNKSVLNEITSQVARVARERLGEKLDRVMLYGSYARDDYDSESDIDIMVIADVNKDELRIIGNELWNVGWELGYEYDVIVSVYVADRATFYRYVDCLPFYKNVINEGVELIA